MIAQYLLHRTPISTTGDRELRSVGTDPLLDEVMYLEGFDRSRGELWRFPLHRITSAAVTQDS